MTGEFPYTSMKDALDRCVQCGEHFDDNAERNFLYGPVVNARTGRRYEWVGDSDPGTPLMHVECYQDVDRERRATENRSLEEYASRD